MENTHSSWRRKERKKICCKAIKYNSSCRGPCKERVIAMTHWCNPFKTLWLRPRLLWLPLQACAIIFISDTFPWLLLAKMCKLPCRPPAQAARRASCPGCITWPARAHKKKKTRKDNNRLIWGRGEVQAYSLVRRHVICLERCSLFWRLCALTFGGRVDPPNLTRQWA